MCIRDRYNSERKIPIDPTVSIEIEKYKDFIFKKIGYKLENDPLFYTTGGKALSQQSMAYAFKIIRKCLNAHPLGYDHVRLYDFRHTMACRTIKKWLLNKENEMCIRDSFRLTCKTELDLDKFV